MVENLPALSAGSAPDWYVVESWLPLWERLRLAPTDLPGVQPLRAGLSDRKPFPREVHRTHLEFLGYAPPERDRASIAHQGSITLRPHQVETVDFIRSRRGTLLASEQRTGKTPAVMYAFEPNRGPMVVVGPLAARAVWHEWAARRFGACVTQHEADERAKDGDPYEPCPICERVGAQIEDRPSFLSLEGRTYRPELVEKYQPHVMFLTFAVVQTWRELSLSLLGRSQIKRLGMFVIDEAHLGGMQNRKSLTVESIRWLNSITYRTVCATGTPLFNKTQGLWPLLDICAPTAFGDYWTFARRYCNPPEAPIWMGDFSFKRLGDVQVGDEVIGWEARTEQVKKSGKKLYNQKKLTRARVTQITKRHAPIVKVTFASGRQLRCTADHRWLSAHKHQDYQFVDAKPGRVLCRVIDPTPSLPVEHARVAGWLGGIMDGEGTGMRLAQSAEKNPIVYAEIERALTLLGFSFSSKPMAVNLNGGRDEFVRFLSWCAPVKRGARADKLVLSGRFRKPDRVVSVVPDGFGEVISLTTTTGNYVAWGYASKNCDAKPTEHGWKADGSSNERELKLRLSEIMFRKRWTDIQENLPPITRTVESVSLTQKEKDDIDELAARLRFQTGGAKTAVGVLARLRRLFAEAKLKYGISTIRSTILDGHSCIAWAWHTDVAERLVEKLKAQGVSVSGPITGKVTGNDRERILTEARERADKGPHVLVANIAALGFAVNLNWASHEVFVELDWSPPNIAQAEMRPFDGTNKVSAVYLVADCDVDESLVEALLSKLENQDSLGLRAGVGDVSDVLSRTFKISGQTLDDLAGALMANAEGEAA